MRTTLTIDNDVLYAAKEIARAEGRTAGAVISDFFRRGLATPQPTGSADGRDRALAELGVQRFGSGKTVVTGDDVNRIREELGI